MKIIPIEQGREPLLDPDIAWNGIVGDLATTSLDDEQNPGGLRATQALATAVLICLMTDRRVDESELRDGDENRGWPGDSFGVDPGDPPLGSKLWILRRRALTAEIETLAEDYAREALQTLVDQGAVARFDVTATANRSAGRLDLEVTAYGRAGAEVYNQKFAVLWDQLNGISNPLA
ncbi:phage GP46 family protein [Oricola thermophila]|uniref:Phage GP46 family protein n=1 Tax=Oricola thermophila TaxID=2742145 RepID=A0A6N1VKF6_9HYPH|nr:phage GP46 family protein [Oricola thermophila]QKV20235.1 phage GP46 family protein [Oricola thermophila]